MREQYVIKAAIKLDNGYWKYGHVFSVWVTPGPRKGMAHQAAEAEARRLYPGCQIVSVACA